MRIPSVLLFGACLLFPVAAMAPGPAFVEWPSNPVWDPPDAADKAYYPCVIYDIGQFSGHGTSAHYKMWYADGNGQYEALTCSADGIAWGSPVQTTGIAAGGYHAKVVYVPEGYAAAGGPCFYKIWYWDSNADLYSISALRAADSVDGVAWLNDQPLTQDAAMPLVTSDPSNWSAGSYGPVTILRNPSASNSGSSPFDYTYAMYYDVTTGGVEAIALGYSADGNHWTRHGAGPVLPHGSPGDWDSDYATLGTVIPGDDGVWRMWYSGSGPSGGAEQGIGYATSPDGLVWTKDGGNPIFSIYQGVAWRDVRCYTPSALYSLTGFDGNGERANYKMWFTGLASSDSNRTVGYASVAMLSVPPVSTDDAYCVVENASLGVPAPGVLGNDTDANLLPLTALLVSDTAHGGLALVPDGSFVYVPVRGWHGTDSFAYRADNGKAVGNTATVTITVRKAKKKYNFVVLRDNDGCAMANDTEGVSGLGWLLPFLPPLAALALRRTRPVRPSPVPCSRAG